MAPEIGRNLESLRAQLAELELTQLLNGKDDRNNAIITLHSGAGGPKPRIAEMLLRIHALGGKERFCRGGPDYLPDEEAGIKSATLLVQG